LAGVSLIVFASSLGIELETLYDPSTDARQSYVVVGLDPRPEAIPHHLQHKHRPRPGQALHAVADAFAEFNRAIVDAVAPHVVAVKPQLAFYEKYTKWWAAW
jgi:orotidine-5'-phosphate decarboxylase